MNKFLQKKKKNHCILKIVSVSETKRSANIKN